VHHLVRGDQSGGLFGLYRWEMAGPPTGPGPHLHRTITETFHVLEGLVRIYDGRAWVDCGPGDTVHVPVGGVHGFRNESGAPAAMLLHFAPCAPREAYFEGIPRLAEMAPDEITAFFAAHDNHWVPGPPAT
jgi:mannose-6-phosphate isomerase-like protein (cupin superfamily)